MRRLGVRCAWSMVVLALAVVALSWPGVAGVPAAAAGEGFLETFDGSPGSPQTWRPAGWLNSNYASVMDAYTMPPTVAGHGKDCAAPPASHLQSGSPADAYFLCKDHVMTTGQQSMRLTIVPPVVSDVSGPDGMTARWDASTLGSSERDWQEIWVVPYGDDFPVAGDFERAPQRGVKILSHLPSKSGCANCGWFGVSVFRDGREVWTAPCCGDLFTSRAEVSASRRDTFELRVSRTHLSFGAPAYGLKWADTAVPAGLIDWDASLLYLHHAAYSPGKGGDCPADRSDCGHNSWHWDTLSVQPAAPLTVRDPQARLADAANPEVAFNGPAAPGSVFRGWVMGGGWRNLQHSLDGGASWQATPIERSDGVDEHMQALKFPVPAGTQRVRFRKADGGGFVVGDPRLVARGGPGATLPAATATPVAAATATIVATAAPPAPTRTPAPVITRTPAPAATSTAAPSATAVPQTATPSPAPAASRTPAASATATPEYTVGGGASPGTLARGGSVALSAQVTSRTAGSALIDLEVYGPSGERVFQAYHDGQAFAAGERREFGDAWTVPANAPAGTYTLKVGVFTSGWGRVYSWNDQAAQFRVSALQINR